MAKGNLKLQWQFKSLKFKVENLFIPCEACEACEARPFLNYNSDILSDILFFSYFLCFLAHNQQFYVCNFW